MRLLTLFVGVVMAIVCGVDFSSWSIGAAQAAAVLAGRLQERVVLVHVLEPTVEMLDGNQRPAVEALLRERLVTEAKALEAPGPVEVVVRAGPVVETLDAVAVERRARLVVVGSAGHGGRAERLASKSRVPVLVVRAGDVFTKWVHGQGLRLLLAVDDGPAAASAVRWVEALRKTAPVDVVVGRVYYQGEAHERFGLARASSYTDADPRVDALIARGLEAQVPSLEGQGEVRYRAKLGIGRVAEHLLELAEAERCDLVVVGAHGRSGVARLWSVSAATLHLSRQSVAVVPLDEQAARTPVPQTKRVLVTTDLSELGNAAVPWAYAIVESGGEVTLLHVTLATDDGAQPARRELLPAPPSSVERDVAAALRALTPTSADRKAVVSRTEIVRSPTPALAIAAAAERVAADVIVIASHGRSGVAKTLFGSVASEVMRLSRRPVFVVRSTQ